MVTEPTPDSRKRVVGTRATGLARMNANNKDRARRRATLAMQVWALTRNLHTVAATPFEGGTLYHDAASASRGIARLSAQVGKAEFAEMRTASLSLLTDVLQRQLRVYNDEAGAEAPNRLVMLAATREIRATDESIRKLMGYDAPRQIAVSGPGGGPVELDVTARVESLYERLMAARGEVIEAEVVEPDDEVEEA